MGGVTVTSVRKSGPGEKHGIGVTDRIIVIGETAFAETAWVEQADFDAALADAPRPVQVVFRSTRAGVVGDEAATDGAWAAILSFIKNEPARAKGIGELFTTWDRDGSGKLSVEELGRALLSFGVALDPRQLDGFRNSVDENGDGEISLDEFTKAVVARHQLAAKAAAAEKAGGGSGGAAGGAAKRRATTGSSPATASAAAPAPAAEAAAPAAPAPAARAATPQPRALSGPSGAPLPPPGSCAPLSLPAEADSALVFAGKDAYSRAWLKVLAFLRASPGNAQRVKQLFDDLEASIQKKADDAKAAKGSPKRPSMAAGKAGAGAPPVARRWSFVPGMGSSLKGKGKGVPVLELGIGLRTVGVPLDDAELKAFFDGADVNGDGRLTLEEFTGAVAKRREIEQAGQRAGVVLASVLGYLTFGGAGAAAGVARVFSVLGKDAPELGKKGAVTGDQLVDGLKIAGVEGWTPESEAGLKAVVEERFGGALTHAELSAQVEALQEARAAAGLRDDDNEEEDGGDGGGEDGDEGEGGEHSPYGSLGKNMSTEEAVEKAKVRSLEFKLKALERQLEESKTVPAAASQPRPFSVGGGRSASESRAPATPSAKGSGGGGGGGGRGGGALGKGVARSASESRAPSPAAQPVAEAKTSSDGGGRGGAKPQPRLQSSAAALGLSTSEAGRKKAQLAAAHAAQAEAEAAAARAGGGGGAAPEEVLYFSAGDAVEIRDEDSEPWAKGTVSQGGRTGAGRLSLPKVVKDGWDKPYFYKQVRWPAESNGEANDSGGGGGGGGGVRFAGEPAAAVGAAGAGAAEALESSLLKLLAFIQADKGNAVALSTVFVRHERLERAKAGGGDPSGGLLLGALVAEFDALGVGFSSAEVAAFLAAYDANGDGKMSLTEFTQVIAAANAMKKSRRK